MFLKFTCWLLIVLYSQLLTSNFIKSGTKWNLISRDSGKNVEGLIISHYRRYRRIFAPWTPPGPLGPFDPARLNSRLWCTFDTLVTPTPVTLLLHVLHGGTTTWNSLPPTSCTRLLKIFNKNIGISRISLFAETTQSNTQQNSRLGSINLDASKCSSTHDSVQNLLVV